MLASLILAAEEAEPSKTLFYVAGAVLVVFALAVSAVGITRHDSFPPSKAVSRGLMGVAALLVAFAMATAVITA